MFSSQSMTLQVMPQEGFTFLNKPSIAVQRARYEGLKFVTHNCSRRAKAIYPCIILTNKYLLVCKYTMMQGQCSIQRGKKTLFHRLIGISHSHRTLLATN